MVIAIEPILTQAKRALQESNFHDIRNLQVERANDSLVISGSVSCYYHKQQAQEAIRAVSGDLMVINEVDVSQA